MNWFLFNSFFFSFKRWFRVNFLLFGSFKFLFWRGSGILKWLFVSWWIFLCIVFRNFWFLMERGFLLVCCLLKLRVNILDILLGLIIFFICVLNVKWYIFFFGVFWILWVMIWLYVILFLILVFFLFDDFMVLMIFYLRVVFLVYGLFVFFGIIFNGFMVWG